jgi:hypothetical protein
MRWLTASRLDHLVHTALDMETLPRQSHRRSARPHVKFGFGDWRRAGEGVGGVMWWLRHYRVINRWNQRQRFKLDF